MRPIASGSQCHVVTVGPRARKHAGDLETDHARAELVDELGSRVVVVQERPAGRVAGIEASSRPRMFRRRSASAAYSTPLEVFARGHREGATYKPTRLRGSEPQGGDRS